MRNKKKEIKNIKDIEAILNIADVCRLGLSYKDKPYIVPVNFAYRNNELFIHSAKVGKKIEMIEKNNGVCFEVDIESEVLLPSDPSDCTTKYKSVIGYGRAFLIDDSDTKQKALDMLINKYYKTKENRTFEYPKRKIDATRIIKIEIDEMSGKKSGY